MVSICFYTLCYNLVLTPCQICVIDLINSGNGSMDQWDVFTIKCISCDVIKPIAHVIELTVI